MKRSALGAALLGALLLTACSAPAPQISEGPVTPPTTVRQEDRPAPSVPPKPAHVDIHGLYMTGWTAGSELFYDLVDYMQESGLNAVVIDVQDDDGLTSWPVAVPLAAEIGANEMKIRDVAERLKYLKERGIYTVGRVVVYADPLLGARRPDLAIQGGNFIDTRGIRWPDPYNRAVWEYKVAIAKEAAKAGFDEIQFDYIRFPEHRIPGYNAEVPVEQRTAAIESFLRYAADELHPLDVFISADLFGLTTTVEPGDDMEIGQNYNQVAQIVDYVWPMVYPSHYAPGTYGIADPNQEPGRIVYESLVGAQRRTPSSPRTIHRPWIQDFNYGAAYGKAEIEAQIKGLAEAGIYQWVLWDPSNRYTRGVNYAIGGGKSGPEGAWQLAESERAAASFTPES